MDKGLLSLLDREVNLAGQSAAGSSERGVARLDEDAAGRFAPEVPLEGTRIILTGGEYLETSGDGYVRRIALSLSVVEKCFGLSLPRDQVLDGALPLAVISGRPSLPALDFFTARLIAEALTKPDHDRQRELSRRPEPYATV
ncbi:hypothetical protein ACWERF_20420 [Streptomyces griseoluteus]